MLPQTLQFLFFKYRLQETILFKGLRGHLASVGFDRQGENFVHLPWPCAAQSFKIDVTKLSLQIPL